MKENFKIENTFKFLFLRNIETLNLKIMSRKLSITLSQKISYSESIEKIIAN
jgi:hypothetical protein